jgi:itaconate CoA-transferase
LKDAKDLAVLKQLLGRVDVLVQNLALGAIDRLGLSYDALSEINPKLIVCDRSSLSGTAQRSLNRESLKDIIVEVFSAFTADEVVSRLDVAGIANASVNDMQGVCVARSRQVNVIDCGSTAYCLPCLRMNRYL